MQTTNVTKAIKKQGKQPVEYISILQYNNSS